MVPGDVQLTGRVILGDVASKIRFRKEALAAGRTDDVGLSHGFPLRRVLLDRTAAEQPGDDHADRQDHDEEANARCP